MTNVDMRNDRSHPQKIDNKLLNQWCQKHQIDFCILFGSSVSGKVHQNSDIDLAVFSAKNGLMQKKLQLIGELEDIIGATIDLIILHADMSPLLLHEIMTKGKPLYISNPEIYIEKQIYAIKLYDDVAFLKRWQDLSLSLRLKRLKNVVSND